MRYYSDVDGSHEKEQTAANEGELGAKIQPPCGAGPTRSKVVHFPSPPLPDSEDVRMEKINPYAFYVLGTELHPLTAISSNEGKIAVKSLFFPLWNADIAMDRLLSGDLIKLDFSRSAAQTLKNRLHDMFVTHFLDDKGDIKFPSEGEEPYIWSWQWNSITAALSTFQTIFQTEMEKATTYQVSKKGIYSTVDLVESAEEVFPAELAPFVNQKTKDDIHAAGRCLAFNLPTAAGFHAARGIEGQMELYWQTFTKKTGTCHGWQDYIDDLRKVMTAGIVPVPEERTVKMLELIKAHDRNPVMHPRDVILSDIDARILFSSAEGVIIAMAQEIKEARKALGLMPATLAIAATP